MASLTQRTMSTPTDTLTQNDRRGVPSFLRGRADIAPLRTPAGQVAFASSALMVAAAEFAISPPILLILIGLRLVRVVDAAVWGLVTLVPLSLSISFLALVSARLAQATVVRDAGARLEAPGSPRGSFA